MKNLLILLAISSFFISCKFNEINEDNIKKQVKDSTIAGADKDNNGCLASAGYTWSKLNKDCVKAFSGIQLNPSDNISTEDETLCSYVLFNENGDKAEVFLPEGKSFILNKSDQSKTWASGDYQLINNSGYQLKKSGVVIFSGDGQIGNKISGSDNPEGQE